MDSLPINFLNPIPGTPLGDTPPLPPDEALKIVAVARHMMPAQQILLAGGRERILGDRQPEIFRAGASGILIGDYLTTKGQSPEEDHRMVRDLGLELAPCGGHRDEAEAAAKAAV
ncbi:MAG: hypothetical protein M5R36_17710 [Deltaproteobacteria bacterium]|nr:hypothetical protein [Deltaproteobacteria bacterium]